MPYKNPERKRQWEREHREQRNAMRKTLRQAERSGYPSVPMPVPDPVSTKDSGSGWKVLLGLAVGLGVVLLGVSAGVRLPEIGDR